MEIVEIKCAGCGMMRKWRGYECLTFCDCLADKPEDESNLLDAQVSDDLGGRNCSTCKNWDAYTTGMDEYPQCTGIAYCKKGHWENGKPNDDYTKCFIDCVDWEKNDSPNHR